VKALLFAVASMALAGWATAAGAAPPPEKTNEVHAQGCVQAAAEGRCIVLKDVESGKIYNLLIKGAGPDIGTGIGFTGTPYAGASVCKQGDPVQITSWTRKDYMKCTRVRTRRVQ
jgi:hypothetical protein